MKPLILSLFDEHPALDAIAAALQLDTQPVILRSFPDGESYVRFATPLQTEDVIVLNSLEYPNDKILPLILVAQTARALGAKRVGLCAPYLAYMRQDKQFQPGEGITSAYFAALLSTHFDWLVTVDPHLHRYHELSEIYTIPTQCLHAAQTIADWLKQHVNKPLLIGPDSESMQWVSEVAGLMQAPFVVLEKTRHGDYAVEVTTPKVGEDYHDHTPVLLDDIISTAQTMIQTVHKVKQLYQTPPVCVGVHGIFAQDAYAALKQAGAGQIVTCNTIAHESNQIDLANVLAKGIDAILDTL